MKQLLRRLQRLISRRGETLLASAVKELEKVQQAATRAEAVLVTEIQHENEDIAAEREKLALREAKSAAALATLQAAKERSRRISDRMGAVLS